MTFEISPSVLWENEFAAGDGLRVLILVAVENWSKRLLSCSRKWLKVGERGRKGEKASHFSSTSTSGSRDDSSKTCGKFPLVAFENGEQADSSENTKGTREIRLGSRELQADAT